MRALRLLVLAFLLLPVTARAALRIVAAEAVYGDIARQVAGPEADIASILTRPADDPHAFEPSPSVARAVAQADILILNGAGYDPWMERLAGAARHAQVIVVARLLGRTAGDNPHLWYDPAAVPALARALAAALARADPAHASAYAARRDRLLASLAPLTAHLAALAARFRGTEVTATEPVFGYLAGAAGLVMLNQRFQIAVMNGTEPGPSDVAAFEDSLRRHRARLLIYNTQATDPAARRMQEIARAAGVPVLGVTETEPPGTPYQRWIGDELAALERALSGAPP